MQTDKRVGVPGGEAALGMNSLVIAGTFWIFFFFFFCESPKMGSKVLLLYSDKFKDPPKVSMENAALQQGSPASNLDLVSSP